MRILQKPVGHTMFTGKARESKGIPDFYLHVAILKRLPRPQCTSLSSATQYPHRCWRAAGYGLGGIGWSKEDMEPYAHLCQSQKQRSCCAVRSWPLFLWLLWAPLDHNPGRWKHGKADNRDWRILHGQKAKERKKKSLWVNDEPKCLPNVHVHNHITSTKRTSGLRRALVGRFLCVLWALTVSADTFGWACWGGFMCGCCRSGSLQWSATVYEALPEWPPLNTEYTVWVYTNYK